MQYMTDKRGRIVLDAKKSFRDGQMRLRVYAKELDPSHTGWSHNKNVLEKRVPRETPFEEYSEILKAMCVVAVLKLGHPGGYKLRTKIR